MNHPNLPRAPIVEGLVQMLFKPRQGAHMGDLKAFAERMRQRYPTCKDLREVRGQFTVTAVGDGAQSIASEVVGYRLERQEPNFVVHAKIGELLVSRLKQYKDWEELISETKLVLAEYASICAPEVIIRVATRFVNEIRLPLKDLDFDDYLAIGPRVPPSLPQLVDQFWSRVVIPDPETGASIAMTQATGSSDPAANTLSILMDIDVYKEQELVTGEEKVWQLLGKMRDLKNRTFFGALTPKAIQLFS